MVLRWIGYAIALLVAIVAIASVAGGFWLRSDGGRAWLIARITGFVDGKIDGRLHIGRLEGPLWGWVVLEDVRVYDLDGNEAGRARQVAVAFDPWHAALHRNHIHRLYVVDPVLEAKAFTDGRLHLARLTRWLRERQRSLRIDGIVALNADARLPPLNGPVEQLARAKVLARLFFVSHSRWGRVDLLDGHGSMTMQRGPAHDFQADATLRWSPQTRIAVDPAHLRVGGSAIDGRASVEKDRFDVDLTRLEVTARDFHQLVKSEAWPADLRGRAALHGPLDHIVLDVLLHPGDGKVHLRGNADWPHKMLTATVDHENLRGGFFPGKPPFVMDSARVQLRLRYVGRGVVGPAEIENARGSYKDVPFWNGSAAAVFFRDGIDFSRGAADSGYGTFTGRAHLTWKGLVQLDARLLRKHFTLDAQLRKLPKQKVHWRIAGVGGRRPTERGAGGHPL
jgi:hypothetical protein